MWRNNLDGSTKQQFKEFHTILLGTLCTFQK